VYSVFPSLEQSTLPVNTSPLPSAFSPNEIKGHEFQEWVNCELEIRVGIGHDCLADLRHAIGLNHYICRQQQKSAHGLREMQQVSKQQSDSSRKKGFIICCYIQNWKRISCLLSSDHIILTRQVEDRLKGLKLLSQYSLGDSGGHK